MPPAKAQGGEPQSFAIRGATIVPVSGPRIENGTVIVSQGVITAVGKDVNFPQETWVIDGKGLTVYPGLIDSFTDIGLISGATSGGESGGRAPDTNARGPEDRPASTPWRDAAGDATLTTSASTHGAAADSPRSSPHTRVEFFQDKPRCSTSVANAMAISW